MTLKKTINSNPYSDSLSSHTHKKYFLLLLLLKGCNSGCSTIINFPAYQSNSETTVSICSEFFPEVQKKIVEQYSGFRPSKSQIPHFSILFDLIFIFIFSKKSKKICSFVFLFYLIYNQVFIFFF